MAHHTHHCDIEAEPLTRYRPGGYHPVLLGDIFHNQQYRVLNKLGWGSWGTTWLVRDQLHHRNVALKICVSEKNTSKEVQILRLISRLPKSHPGQSHIVQILDSFSIAGPNGNHDCIVMELLGPSMDAIADLICDDDRLPAVAAKRAAYQVLQALDLLAHHGIAHGDIHTNNVALVPDILITAPEATVLSAFRKAESGPVYRKDGKPLNESFPPYLVRSSLLKPSRVREILAAGSLDVKLIDFGEAFVNQEAPSTLCTPLVVRAPEVIFGDRLDHRVDVWSAGCLLFQLVTGQPPFDAYMVTPTSLVLQVVSTVQHNNKLPERWERKFKAMKSSAESHGQSGLEEPESLEERLHQAYHWDERKPEFSEQDLREISRLVGMMLCLEPGNRCSPRRILEDPWWTRG